MLLEFAASSSSSSSSSSRLPLLVISLLCAIVPLCHFGTAAGAPQNGPAAGYASGRIPVLYEAYYPEPREWSPQASLDEIQKLRDLTSQLLKEEEQLGELAQAAAVAAAPENVFEPRSQLLRYVFSAPSKPFYPPPPADAAATDRVSKDDVQVTSLTVSDVGRHRIRHHHGEADWYIKRRFAPSPTS